MSIVSYDDFNSKKAKVLHYLEDLKDIVDGLNELGLTINSSAIQDLIKKAKEDNFKVLVIGEFKNGKSTFINSLMGEKVLPAHSTPCTAVINEVKYGNEKKATLYFKNPLPKKVSGIEPEIKQYMKRYEGGEIPPKEIDPGRLDDFVVIQDPTEKQEISISETPYSKVVLEYPIELCKNGIEIIDSPGLNENGARTKVTEDYLNQADAILFVFRCPQIASKSETDYITDNIQARGYKDIFFICNAINQVDEEEQDRLIEFGIKKLSPLTSFGKDGIFFLDALGALKAKTKKDEMILQETGLPKFENSLSEYLNNFRGKAKLKQILEPGKGFISDLNLHIERYLKALDQDVKALEERIRQAMPKLEIAEERKDLVVKNIDLSMHDFQKQIENLMEKQYGIIVSKIPDVVEEMDLDNHMTVNPFKQKEKKEALENEVISNLDKFVQKEMGAWIKTDLNQFIDSFIDDLEKKLGEDIDIFYQNLDEFRYHVSGVENPKDISGFERVSATILGTIVGGPLYGALGASLGFGEIAKRSAITIGVSAVSGVILAFTPLGIAAITTGASIALIGAGVVQLFTGGKSLTDKYKNKLKNNFIDSLNESKEKNCHDYAISVTKEVTERFNLIIKALDNEIQIEKNKIDALKRDKENNEEVIEKKRSSLEEYKFRLNVIGKEFTKIAYEIE